MLQCVIILSVTNWALSVRRDTDTHSTDDEVGHRFQHSYLFLNLAPEDIRHITLRLSESTQHPHATPLANHRRNVSPCTHTRARTHRLLSALIGGREVTARGAKPNRRSSKPSFYANATENLSIESMELYATMRSKTVHQIIFLLEYISIDLNMQ